jgi:hypothetical protein
MSERTFLITGATGFLGGGAVAVAALRAGYGPKLRLLVRGSAEGTPAMRLFNNLRRLGATEAELSSLGDDFMLEADLGRKAAFEGHRAHAAAEYHASVGPGIYSAPAFPGARVPGTFCFRLSMPSTRIASTRALPTSWVFTPTKRPTPRPARQLNMT